MPVSRKNVFSVDGENGAVFNFTAIGEVLEIGDGVEEIVRMTIGEAEALVTFLTEWVTGRLA